MKRSPQVWVLMTALAATAFAADPWASKPYQKWSAQDCHKVLWDSPWGRTYNIQKATLRELNRDPFGQTPTPQSGPTVRPAGNNPVQAFPNSNSSGAEAGVIDPRITYHASFRSARPARLAFAQLSRLEAKWDQMSDEQKKSFEDRQKRFLAVSFPDKIIIHVSYDSNLGQIDRELANYWQTQTLSTLKQTVFLSGPDGDRVEPIEYYVGPGALREFQFAFPRRDDHDLSKPLVFEFRHPPIANEREERVYLKFPAPVEMKFDGMPTY